MDVGAVAALGAALSSVRIEAQFAAHALSTQLGVVQNLGQNTVQLIQGAALDPASRKVLDLKI